MASPSSASSSQNMSINMAELLSGPALRHLEPHPGGLWTLTGQQQDSYTIAYVMEGRGEAVYYTVQACTNEADVRQHCGSHIYDVPGARNESSQQPNSPGGQSSSSQMTANNPPMQLVLRPPPYTPHSLGQANHDPQAFNFNSMPSDAHAIAISRLQHPPQFGMVQPMVPMAPYQNQIAPGAPLSNNQMHAPAADQSPNNIHWSFTNPYLHSTNPPPVVNNRHTSDHAQNSQHGAVTQASPWGENLTRTAGPSNNNGLPSWDLMYPRQ